MPSDSSFPISDHCDGLRFFNPRGHVNRTWLDVLKWRRTSTAQPWPRSVTIEPHSLPPFTVEDKVSCTWINHATFLLRFPKCNVLTDPVYSNCAGPLGRLGPRRVHPPGINYRQLPKIAIILLSHDHYDHCDLPTLRRLARDHAPKVITPLGNGALLRRAGFDHANIIELDWWQQQRTGSGPTVTLTPARHWSNRLSGPRNGRLWGGFHLQAEQRNVLFTGDTAYDPEHFTTIRRRLGAPDLALIPIGAYEPRWFMSAQHCNPAEAVQIHIELGARQSVGMHWGTFQLTDEARDTPVTALQAAIQSNSVAKHSFRTLNPGETIFAP
jgi:L-ascorbate metabolism protein UlaG (beta-lactamase superfamily)|uniref:MBL fold metallo-hydrolase n=1 Tax=Cephaloticoccus sp. TaxID=1985742 RepID=UPI004049176D